MHNKKRMFVSFFLVITMALQMLCVIPVSAAESFSAELKVKTIVTGFAANLPIEVSDDVTGDVIISIFGLQKTVTDGYIKLTAAEVPSVTEATDFPVTATANGVIIPLGDIRVVTLPMNIWEMTADVVGEDVVLSFGAVPNLEKIQVLLNGTAVSYTVEGSGNIIRIAKKLIDGNNTIAVKGVRFPEFFPSFSFTYSAQVEFSVPEPDGFGLVHYGRAADIYVDEKDYPGIIHAAENLTKDIALVTDVEAQFKSNADGLSKYAVIAGAIGNSPVIDKLIEDGKLDVSAIKGKWESYVIDYIDNPVPGVSRGLVIAGSDMRGTVFGIYKISETIGVSAWSFFADSVPVHKNALVLPTKSIVQGEPSVKYRGIFINDERSLDRWMNQYAKANGHTPPKYDSRGAYWFTHEFYVEVFDMILRQYGNYLWPAMWNNSFWADDPLNGQLANDYGIVIGTTHQEFMNCPDKEWVWSNLGNFQWINPSYPEPENWVYTNRDAMIKKWTETMEETKNFEAVVNMGLRGLNDVAIFPSGTKDQNIALLNDVIKEQRKIIENVHGTTDIPQSVIIYKEVESFYWGDNAADPNSGWKASIADDITTILCDDNHGNVRGLPLELNRSRSGGYGMYYHFDYNGAPRSYRWVDATPLEKIREQMTMAYDYGIQRIWVTNVGDLKFNEPPIDYWFKLAYDIEKWGALEGPDIAHEEFAQMQFGEELGDDIADIIFEYTFMNNVRKPEIVFGNTFSHTYFNEFENMHAKYTDIARRALAIKKEIPAERMDAYYNLVLHPTLVSWNAWNLAYYLGKNQIYQGLGISAVNDYEQIVRASLAFDNFIYQYIYGDPRIMDETYAATVNTIKAWLGPIVGDNIIDADENGYYCVGNGKYYGYYPRRELTEPFAVVRDTSIYYLLLTTWNHPTSQKTFTTTGTAHNRLYTLTVPETSEMVVLPQAWLGTALPNAKTGSVDLYKFTNYADETRFIDIATTGSTAFDYTAAANNDWIILSKAGGTVSAGNKVDRFFVTIDWVKVPATGATGSITISGADATVTVNVTAEVFDTDTLPNKTFIETDGYISILSKNFAQSVPATKNGISYEWTKLPNYGRELSSMKVMPNDPNAGYGNARIPGEDSPYLEYNVYIKTPGAIDIITQWAPTNGNDARQLTTLDYAVSLGNEAPQRVRSLGRDFYVNNAGNIPWADGAEAATRTIITRNNGGACMSAHAVTKPGVYTIRIYMVNDGLTLQKILVGTSILPRTTVAAATVTDTMTGERFSSPAYTTPTLLTGNRYNYHNAVAGTATTASTAGTLATYFGPPESPCVFGEPSSYKNRIYPIPQKVDYLSGDFVMEGEVNVYLGNQADLATKRKIAEILADEGIPYKFGAAIAEGANNIILGVNGGDAIAKAYFEGAAFTDTSALDPANGFDGYVLGTNDNNIVIMGRNDAALYNGVVTLKQMLALSHTVRSVLINDFADSEVRGIIEGYYGTPWSFEVCKDLIEMSGDYKMNTFVYAPKDDPYHYRQWDVPYPDEQLAELKKLVEIANENNVTFIWTTHVGATMDFFDGDDAFNATRPVLSNPQWLESNRTGTWPVPPNQKAIDSYSEVETYAKLFAKFEQLYSIGVRQFGFLIDDIGFPEARFNIPYYTLAANRVVDWGKSKGDVGRLMVCPSYYGQDDTAYNGRYYMRTLKGNPYGGGITVVPATATGPDWEGEPVVVQEPGLDESVMVMWTGDGTMSNVHYDPTAYGGNSGASRMGQGTYFFFNGGAHAGTADPTGENPIYGQTGMRRLPLIWWNYPCNDFIYNPYQLMIGPTPVDMNNRGNNGSGVMLDNFYGLNPNAKGTLHGVLSNPMQQGIASEIALFGVADYSWNMDGFDAIKNWENSFQFLFPEVADSLFAFAQHNQWARTGFDVVKMSKNTESLQLKPYLDAMSAALPSAITTMEPAAVRAAGANLMVEIDVLEAAIFDIQANGSALLLGDFDPWLKKGANQCRYIRNTVNMYNAYFNGEFSALMDSYSATETDRLLWSTYTALGRGTPRAVTVGAQYFQPFIDTLNTRRNAFIGSVASADYKAALLVLVNKAKDLSPTGNFLVAVNEAQALTENEAATVRQVAEAGVKLEGYISAANAPDSYKIYPIPQKIDYQASGFALVGEVNVYLGNSTDVATKTAIETILKEEGIRYRFGTSIAAGANNIILGVNGDETAAETYFKGAAFADTSALTATNGFDGYVLGTHNDNVVIIGRDDRALYYGVMTLKQMLSQSHSVKNVLVNDWANVRIRGIIQGYYGHMWDWNDIGDMMDFISEYKMNTFLYGPKDDPYHRANWRDPYPAESMVEFGKLAKKLETDNVNFVWALHPAVGQIYDYNNPDDWDVLIGKIKSLYDVGVRQFAVFMDDSNATTANNTVAQFVAMMNKLQDWADANGCAPFIICPTHYSQSTGAAQQTYWQALQNLDPRIAIMYTGNSTIGRIDEAIVSFPAVETRMGRPITMWFNYPVNDWSGSTSGGELSVQGNLNFGPVKMVAPDVTSLDGLLSNPMTECLPNKVALFSIANYAWNIAAYDWQQSWEDTFEFVQPEVAESFKIIATHSACPPAHSFISSLITQGYFPESEDLIEPFAAYTAARTPELTAQLTEEFNVILAALADFSKNCADKRLLAQIENHLESMKRMLEAGNLVLAGLAAADAGELDLAYSYYLTAQPLFNSLDQLRVVPLFRNSILLKMGQRRIKPFITAQLTNLRNIANAYNAVPAKSVRPIVATPVAPIVTTNMPERITAGELKNLVDGDLSTSITTQGQPYFFQIQLELPEAIPLYDITLWQTTASAAAGSYLRTVAYLEYSLDGVNWNMAVGATDNRVTVNPGTGNVSTVTAQAFGNAAKYIRLRMVDQNATNNAATQSFLAYEITYNATAANRPGETPVLPGAGQTYNAIDGNAATGYYPDGNELVYTFTAPADQAAGTVYVLQGGLTPVPLTVSVLIGDGWVELGAKAAAAAAFSSSAAEKTAVKVTWPIGTKPFIAEIYTVSSEL